VKFVNIAVAMKYDLLTKLVYELFKVC